ncbi:MAG: outer membrane lipoprotein carrier protein LolA [Candidatus Muproteobacteria bacterium RBG_16_62_13]|uniref:Outer-membrane lipoprotein carrier protein n=1 Tax=Candidatus Muproteobacteria bacterium RBG_16_62_13 TaxID=1817756 RepID=A0A1F6SYF9_9PROT|nr:MAG: outer membrane lipoprotein carrier protein LolA [Candidatus Muproteobacteria bacterium RBG_16_62_13]
MKIIQTLLSLSLLVSIPALTVAALERPATDSLRHFFTNVRSFTARFNQVVLDEGLNVIQETNGTLFLERPNKFRWDYDAPFKQVIVADGQKIWIYDAELQQVTVRELRGGLADTPAVLLAGKGRIEDTFTLKNLGTQGKLQWVQLLPKRKDGGFEAIRIGFENGHMRTLEMVDGFGQTTRVTLSQQKENPALEAGRFQFKPPKGVDVVGE